MEFGLSPPDHQCCLHLQPSHILHTLLTSCRLLDFKYLWGMKSALLLLHTAPSPAVYTTEPNESVPRTVLVCRNLLHQQCFPGEVCFVKAPKNVERPNVRMPLQIHPQRCFELWYARTDLGKQHLPAPVDFQGHGQSALNVPSEQGLAAPQPWVSTGSCPPLKAAGRDVAGTNPAGFDLSA